MNKTEVTLDSILLEIAKLFSLEKKIVELNISINIDVATKEELKKKLLEKRKKIYEMRDILIENGLLTGGDDSE